MSDKKMRTRLYLKSGSVVTLDLLNIELQKNGLGDLALLNWEMHPSGKERVLWANLSDISAVTVEDVPVENSDASDE